MDEKKPKNSTHISSAERWVGGILGPLILLGLTIADFLNDGEISQYLIAADILLIFGLTGRMLDLQVWQNFRNRNNNDS